MSFELKLRRLAKKLPESEVPSELHARVLSRLPERHMLQKVGFDMKLILIPALALSMVGAFGGLFALRSNKQQIALLPFPGKIARTQTGTVTLHVVDEQGQPVAKTNISMWSYEQPDPRTGIAPPLRVENMPQGITDADGNFGVTTEMNITHFSASALGETSRWASGEITISEGVQTVTLSEHPEHTITGQLVDTKGKPMMGVKPELYVVGSQTTQQLMTGPNGRFVAWIVPGEEYRLTLNVPGHAPYFKNSIRIQKGDKVDLGTITLH